MTPQTIGSDGRLKDRAGVAPQGAICLVKKNATQSIAANAWVGLVLDNKLVDPYNWFDTTTSRFTPKVPGFYEIDVWAYFQGANSYCYFDIRKNGVEYGRYQDQSSTGRDQTVYGSIPVYLNGTTDYVDFAVQSSNAIPIYGDTGASLYTAFSAKLVGTTIPFIPKPSQFISVANYLPGGLPINGNFTIPQAGDGNYWFMGWGSSYTNTAGVLGAIGFGIDTTATQGQSKQYFQNSGFHIPFPPCFWRVPNLAVGAHTFNIHNDQYCTPDTNDFFSIFAMRE